MSNRFDILREPDAESITESVFSDDEALPKVTMASTEGAHPTTTAGSQSAKPASEASKPPLRRLSSAYYPRLRRPTVAPTILSVPEDPEPQPVLDPDLTTLKVYIPKFEPDAQEIFFFPISRSKLCITSAAANLYFNPPHSTCSEPSRFIVKSWSVAPVKVYIAWVEHKRPILQQDGGILQRWGEEDLPYYRLIDLYNLGSQVEDSRFKDAVIDALQHRADSSQGKILPGLWSVNNACNFQKWRSRGIIWPEEYYEERTFQRPRSTLQMMLEDIFARVPVEKRGREWSQVMLSGPKIFRDGVAKRLYEVSLRGFEGERKREGWVGSSECEFHEHLAGEECSLWAVEGQNRSSEANTKGKGKEKDVEYEGSDVGGVEVENEVGDETARRNDSIAVDLEASMDKKG